MCDEPDHKSFVAKLGDEIGACLPESLRSDKRFMYSLGKLSGLAAGWIVGKTIIELLFPRGDKK